MIYQLVTVNETESLGRLGSQWICPAKCEIITVLMSKGRMLRQMMDSHAQVIAINTRASFSLVYTTGCLKKCLNVRQKLGDTDTNKYTQGPAFVMLTFLAGNQLYEL